MSTSNYGDTVYSNNKKLPIVLCLDVSGSMSYPSGHDGKFCYEVQNDAVQAFLSSIVSVPKALASAEIAIIAFADKVWYKTDFTSIQQMEFKACDDPRLHVASRQVTAEYQVDAVNTKTTFNTPQFKHVPAGIPTRLCPAITCAVQKIDEWFDRYSGTPHYAPFIVLSTDCDRNGLMDTEEDKEKTRELLQAHMEVSNPEDTVIPLFVSIGKRGYMDDLRRYAGAFQDGCIRKEDMSHLSNLFRTLAGCIANTMSYSPARGTVKNQNGGNPILQLVRDTLYDLDEDE